jgi:hypothetical protein
VSKRVLTASGDGTIRVRDISVDPGIPLEEQILEFGVRSATRLGDDGSVQVLSEGEWAEKRRLWEDIVKKRNGKP